MKTGMGNGLILIVVLVACGIVMSVLQAQQVELATAQVQSTAAAAQMPLIETMVGQLGGWLIKFALGVIVAGLAGLIFTWLRSKLRKPPRAWRGGPNAQWQHREPRERGVTTTDLLKIMMMQSGQRPQPPRDQSGNDSDEPKIWR